MKFILLLLFKFILSDNLDKLKGLLIYNYRREIINYNTKYINIGDYIQSIAAEQFIKNKKNIIYLDRDNLVYNGSLIKITFK